LRSPFPKLRSESFRLFECIANVDERPLHVLHRGRESRSSFVDACQRIRANVIVLGEHRHGFIARLFGADMDGEVQRRPDAT
jgi:nucleotide-binding universal stress UspA family protein